MSLQLSDATSVLDGRHGTVPSAHVAPSGRERLPDRWQPGFVRARLVEPLDQVARAGAVAVLVGPAGSGKSVLVDSWLAGGQQRALSVGSCRCAGDVEEVAERIARSDDAVVIIDGVDLAPGTAAARRFAEVVRTRPTGTSVVACTRRTWLVQLAGARALDVVIDAAALALTTSEVDALLESMGLHASPGQADALVERTQGWAIAVHLAALAMRSSDAGAAAAPSLGAADRHFRAFVLDEVLGREPARVRRLLRRCAVLDVVDTSVCARTCDPATDAILRDLASRSVPVEQCGGDPPSYAMHPLFREVLLRDLRAAEPALEDRTLADAAAWYRRRGLDDAAAQILIRTRRWDELLGLIDDRGCVISVDGRHDDALRWVDAIPSAGAGRRPAIVLRRAALLTLAGHTGQAANALHALDEPEATRSELATAQTIRATWIFFDGSPTASVTAAERAIELLDQAPTDRPPVPPHVLGATTGDQLRFIARTAHARGRWLLGQIDAARSELAGLACRAGQPEPFRLAAVGALALLLAWRGDASRAQYEAHRTLAAAGSSPASHDIETVDARLALAHIHRERGDLATAWHHLRAAEAVLAGSRNPTGAAVHTVESAQQLLASGEARRALEVIDAHWASAGRGPLPVVDDRLRALQVQGQIAIGALDQARALVRAAPNPCMTMAAAAAVQVALAGGDLVEAEHHLSALGAVADGGPTARIQLDLLAAVVHQVRGERDDAVAQAGRAIELAVDTGNLRTVIDVGQPAMRLLRMMQRSDPTGDRAAVLALAPMTGSALSDRELEVVRFLPTSLRSAQIAAALYISLNTLKTHLASIYRKLGVKDRAAATQRAIELGLA